MDVSIHKLYWDNYWKTMHAQEDQKSDYTFDGVQREQPVDWLKEEDYYGEVQVMGYNTALPNAKIHCSIKPARPIDDRAWNEMNYEQILILDATDRPLTQVLRFLNRHKGDGCYRLDVERRAFLQPAYRHGHWAEYVALAGSYPGEVQWCYHGRESGNAAYLYSDWDLEEKLPLEEMLHRCMKNWYRNYWVFTKRSEGVTAFRYWAAKQSWGGPGHGANTTEGLAVLVEKEESKWREA